MTQILYGPFDDVFVLRSSLEDAQFDPTVPDDPIALEHYFRSLLESAINRDALMRALEDDPVALGRAMTDQELCQRLAERIASGTMRMERAPELAGVGGGGAQAGVGDEIAQRIAESVAQARGLTRGATAELLRHPGERTQAQQGPAPVVQPRVRDWRLECGHHASDASRAVFQQGSTIQLVPSKGQRKDTVKVWWKDQYLGTLPSALTVRSSGRPDAEARQSSGGGDTATFGFDAEYHGDLEIIDFWKPSFWRGYMERTSYTIAPGPTSINVEVFNPRRFKFEFALPPLAGFKDGVKYEADSVNPKKLVQPKQLERRYETEDTTWKPSSLKLDTTRTNTNPDPSFKPSESQMSLGGAKLWRDDVTSSTGLLTLVGKLLRFSESMRDLVTAIKMFKDYAPTVGWYVDFSLQLMQGGLAVEWYWKEYRDHRVFQFIDVNVAMKIFAIEFEFGVGVGAFSFKLQIFAQLAGEMSIECGMQRSSPDGAPGFTFPALKGKIAGALGARIQAGIFFKFEAKAETAIEAEMTFGINQRNSPVSFDLRARWTGIECTASGSVGPWGIGGNKTWKGRLVEPSAWSGFEFPKEEEYKPPFVSRDRVINVIEKVITDGWNVRVIRPSGSMLGIGDVHWTPHQIAVAMADRIDADPVVARDADTIDGLAHAARGDLDRLGVRFGRDYVEEAAFIAYLDGQFRERLVRSHSPERMMLRANGQH